MAFHEVDRQAEISSKKLPWSLEIFIMKTSRISNNIFSWRSTSVGVKVKVLKILKELQFITKTNILIFTIFIPLIQQIHF